MGITLCLYTAILMAGILLRASVAGNLRWKVIRDSSALCNDYTPAGYFFAQGRSPEHWIVFLESGGGCYSAESCNKRYFSETIRTRFKTNESPSVGPLINYDVMKAKRYINSSNEPLNAFVSPLVTSVTTFQKTSYFQADMSVRGRGILDDNCAENPTFCNHTRVVIPYCSSDLWLANSPSARCNISKALYDGCYSNDYNSCVSIGKSFFTDCFLNAPNQLPFLFRGQAIYRSAFRQLLDDGLDNSSSLTLAGSSAGGVGVINHANWTLQFLRNWTRHANLSVIADSSWFINFRDSVKQLFVGVSTGGDTVQKNGVFSIIETTDTTRVTCKDTTHGSPCCFSAFCMLSTPEYYPLKEVPTFVLFSLYDVYLLANALVGLKATGAGESKNAGAGLAVRFVQTVSEYGGAMNESLNEASGGLANKISYFVTECFQHIYLVTSTLWGEGNLFGNSLVDVSVSFGVFSQSMQPNTWNTMKVGTNKITIRDALNQWYLNRHDSVVTIRDSCSGPHCSATCPDTISLGSAPMNIWSTHAKVFLLLIVSTIAMCCLLAKAVFAVWLVRLGLKQKGYLNDLQQYKEQTELEFPECTEESGVSVSCLGLHYSVTMRTQRVKDEKKDNTVPVVLKRLSSQDTTDDLKNTSEAQTPAKFNTIQEYMTHFSRKKSFYQTNTTKEHEPNKPHYYTTKEILKGISMYFNPGDLCAIMGPSGCGKTTLLDLLTGRRKTGKVEGNIYINGQPIDHVRDWYTANTGYVLQLATPYYDELTVRENITLAALIKLPETFTTRDTFTRIEQVLAVSELQQFADTVVGGAIGPGLSGGQKRRLVIALQLLRLPSVLFLDEPTSGLDATSSYELLTHLNRLADSKRTVILTIHQPRLEIFHMFNRLLLLADGKIAYHGVPDKAYEVFIKALQAKYWNSAPELENENPADIIMDMAGNYRLRAVITEYYEKSTDPQLVCAAIKKACHNNQRKSEGSLGSLGQKLQYAIYGAKRVGDNQGGIFTRLATLEARGAMRASFGQMLYLPIIFFAYGILLGTVYYQSYNPLLLMSGFCVYSVASALFMFPALYLYYQKALEVTAYERADGAGRSVDIVIQGFIRGITLGFFPVIICAAVLYLLLVNHESYSIKVFIQVLLVNLALNQTWVALLIFVICAFPNVAFRLSPIISSVAGFTSGFFVPRESMPYYYRWLFYINPNYYGFTASASLLLNEFNTGCVGSEIECFPSSSQYYLKYFNFDDVNPYLHITVLLIFTAAYIILATLSNSIRHSNLSSHLKRYVHLIRKAQVVEAEVTNQENKYESSIVYFEKEQAISRGPRKENSVKMEEKPCNELLEIPREISADDSGSDARRNAKLRWQKAAMKCTKSNTPEANAKYEGSEGEEDAKCPFLNAGEGHFVWKPRAGGQHRLASLVDEVLQMPRSLSERRKNLEKRVQATRAVLRDTTKSRLTYKAACTSYGHRITFKQAVHLVMDELRCKRSYDFHDIVSKHILDNQRRSNLTSNAQQSSTHPFSISLESKTDQKMVPAPLHENEASINSPVENAPSTSCMCDS